MITVKASLDNYVDGLSIVNGRGKTITFDESDVTLAEEIEPVYLHCGLSSNKVGYSRKIFLKDYPKGITIYGMSRKSIFIKRFDEEEIK